MTGRIAAMIEAVDCAVRRRGAALLGVVNVTPDSFSDGGDHRAPRDAKRRVDELLGEGADLLDIGGESTRPFATPVDPEEQLARVAEVVEYAVARVPTTIDTASGKVARTCLALGAVAINDASLAMDADLADAAAEFEAGYILMHTRGTPREMVGRTDYDGDLVLAVVSEWSAAAAKLRASGVQKGGLLFDPGLGFAKTRAQSIELLARTSDLAARVFPHRVVIGASRKSFLSSFDRQAEPKARVGASVAAAEYAARMGAAVVRVHDVRATRQAIDLAFSLSRIGRGVPSSLGRHV